MREKSTYDNFHIFECVPSNFNLLPPPALGPRKSHAEKSLMIRRYMKNKQIKIKIETNSNEIQFGDADQFEIV